MKKIIVVIMVAAILTMSAVAFAERNGQPGGMPQQGQSGGPMMGGPGPMQGGRPDNGPGQSNGNRPNGQMPNGQGQQSAGRPETSNQSGNEQSSNSFQMPGGEKPANAPEMPSGEKPADAPEMPNGEKPADAPEMPNDEKPEMINFDDMVTSSVISQDTCDKIKAYMEAHKPADKPENGQMPAGNKNGNPPEMNGQMPQMHNEAPERVDLLKELLDAEVITQEEYDALTAAQSDTADTADDTDTAE